MIGPGASAEEIRREFLAAFQANMDNNEVDNQIQEIVTTQLQADELPEEFSEELMDLVEQVNED